MCNQNTPSSLMQTCSGILNTPSGFLNTPSGFPNTPSSLMNTPSGLRAKPSSLRFMALFLLLLGLLGWSATNQAASLSLYYADYDDAGTGEGLYLSSDRFGITRIFGRWDRVEHLDRGLLGAGLYLEFIPLIDVEVGATYQYWGFKDSFPDRDTDHGWGLQGEIALSVLPFVRLTGRVERLQWQDAGDEQIYGAGIRVGLNTGPALFAQIDRFDQSRDNVMRAGLRWGF
jgi:hypothetical protein